MVRCLLRLVLVVAETGEPKVLVVNQKRSLKQIPNTMTAPVEMEGLLLRARELCGQLVSDWMDQTSWKYSMAVLGALVARLCGESRQRDIRKVAETPQLQLPLLLSALFVL